MPTLPKFRVVRMESSIQTVVRDGAPTPVEFHVFVFVAAGDEQYRADQSFSVEIPGGEIRVTTSNPEVVAQLKLGHEYSVNLNAVAG